MADWNSDWCEFIRDAYNMFSSKKTREEIDNRYANQPVEWFGQAVTSIRLDDAPDSISTTLKMPAVWLKRRNSRPFFADHLVLKIAIDPIDALLPLPDDFIRFTAIIESDIGGIWPRVAYQEYQQFDSISVSCKDAVILEKLSFPGE